MSEPITQPSVPQVEGHDGILVVRGSGNCRDWNGIHYKVGLSAKNVGSHQLSMNVATIPPGGVARAHIHVGFEVMLYILEGREWANIVSYTRPRASALDQGFEPRQSAVPLPGDLGQNPLRLVELRRVHGPDAFAPKP